MVHFHEGVNVLIGENDSGVWLYAKRKDNVIIPSFSAGIDGQTDRMDSEARELLKVVYFKPLRDALTDMTHGYKSRLAQILGAHELFKTQKDEQGNSTKHKLESDYENLKNTIEYYFKTVIDVVGSCLDSPMSKLRVFGI